ASMQGEHAPEAVAGALQRLSTVQVDVVAVVRGGGSKLDLAAFDTEEVARAVARMPVPVIAGIGHEIDRSVVDEVAAVPVKTPTAAGEWLVARVQDFATRIERARESIDEQASRALRRSETARAGMAAGLPGARHVVAGHRDRPGRLAEGLTPRCRALLASRARAPARRRGT